MAKKKTNKKLAVFCAVLMLFIGFGVGIFASSFITAQKYTIPASSSDIAQLTLSAEEIKSKELSIHFLGLGNKYTGDCTLIKVGDKEILIDAGSRSSSIKPIYEYASNYIEGKLDYIIVTHAHRDHYAGFATKNYNESLFKLFDCDNIIYFSQSDTDAKMFDY